MSLPNVCEREGTDLENSADCRTLRAGQFAFRPALNFTSRRPKRNGRPLTPLALALRSRSRFARARASLAQWAVQLALTWAVGQWSRKSNWPSSGRLDLLNEKIFKRSKYFLSADPTAHLRANWIFWTTGQPPT